MPGPRRVRSARRIGLLMLVVGLCLSSNTFTFGQRQVPRQQGRPGGDELPKPRQVPDSPRVADGPDILPQSAVHDLDPAIPVTLPEVLKLASIANLDIAQANLVVERARANVLLAKSYYLPSLNVGATYTKHTGTIQRTEGNVIEVDRDSLFTGLGSGMTFSLSTAIFAL